MKLLKPGTIKHVILVSRWQTAAAGPGLSEQLMAKAGTISDAEALQRVDALEASFVRTVSHFREMALRVTVVGPVPDLPVHLPSAMTKALMRGHQLELPYDFQDFMTTP